MIKIHKTHVLMYSFRFGYVCRWEYWIGFKITEYFLPHRWHIWPIFPLRTGCSLQDSSWATSFHSSRRRDWMFRIHPTIVRSPTWSLFPRSSRGWFWSASDLMYTCQSSSVHFSRHTDEGIPPRLLCSESSMIWTLAWSRVPRAFFFRWTSRLHSIQSTPTNYCSDWSLISTSAG